VNGANISNATVEIDSPQDNFATTSLTGQYKTGQAIAGTFDVTFSAVGFISKTVSVTLENGMLTIRDVELDPILSVAGETVEAVTGMAVPNAQVVFANAQNTFTITSGPDGTFDLSGILPGIYNIIAGAWGYDYGQLPNVDLSAGTSPIIIELAPLDGYKDDFVLDYGWTATNTASTGLWERGEPVGTNYNGAASNPDLDVPNDLGDQCYVTGNGGGGAGDFDVDNGTVILTSPTMNLAGFSQPILSYARWFFNDGGSGTPNDNLIVRITNGTDVVVLETISQSSSTWNNSPEFDLASLITLTDNMQVIFEAGDYDPGHLVEAAVDAFLVRENCLSPAVDFTFSTQDLEVSFTNNSTGGTAVEWDFGDNSTSNEENPVHTYASPGEYEVTLSITNDCGLSVATQTIVISASGTTGLDAKAYSLEAAPNPFNGQVSIRYQLKDAFGDASLQVYDVLGKQVANAVLAQKSGVVDFGPEFQSGGVYFLRLVVDGQSGKAVRIVKLSE
ncbi:MAG: PKD domain-containing protein, partial [Saprospiraceae bacterium]